MTIGNCDLALPSGLQSPSPSAVILFSFTKPTSASEWYVDFSDQSNGNAGQGCDFNSQVTVTVAPFTLPTHITEDFDGTPNTIK